MATMNQRSTYALDSGTILAIRELAARWNVSQAEVIRRSVRQAAEQAAAEEACSPEQVVAHYRAQPPARSWDEALALVAQLREERHEDDERRMQRQVQP